MFPSLRKVQNIILDILFPPICLNCRKSFNHQNKLICENCLSLIKINYTLFCPICRARLADNKRVCAHYYDYDDDHDKKKRSFYYYLAAAGNYDDPVLQNLIHYFKYKRFKNLAPILGEILIKYLNNLFENWKLKIENFIIVPVPLHPRRERERGFNQAKILAEIVAHHFNLTLIDALKRIKNTKPQAKIKDIEKRMKNISNCFVTKSQEVIKGKNIILIDDVFTSGATINEAVKVLKQNGAKKVIALVLAKAG